MKHWNWIDTFVLPAAVAVLNTSWVWLWVLWSVRAVPPSVVAAPISPLVLVLLPLGGYAITRWALKSEAPGLKPRLVITLAGLVFILAALWQTYRFIGPIGIVRELVDWGNFISPVFLGLVACAFLWYQGIQLGRSSLPQESLERAFYGGIIALGSVYAVNQLRSLILPAEALAAAMACFATGLGGLALVSVENARRWQEALTGSWPALNRYWLGTVASVIASILLIAVLVAGVFSPQAFGRLASGVNLVVDAVTIGIIVFLGSLVFIIATLLWPAVHLLAQAAGQVNLHLPVFPNVRQTSRQALDFFQHYPVLNFARRGLVLAIIVGGLLILFWWAVRRFGRRARRDADETRESIATRELLLDQLRALLRRHPTARPEPPYLALSGPNDDPRLIVRRAYQAMLEWAPAISLPPRAAGQTPAAYARTLSEALPEGGVAIETLTGAYVQARYAAEEPSMDVARSAQGAISQLRMLTPRFGRSGDQVWPPAVPGSK